MQREDGTSHWCSAPFRFVTVLALRISEYEDFRDIVKVAAGDKRAGFSQAFVCFLFSLTAGHDANTHFDKAMWTRLEGSRTAAAAQRRQTQLL